MVRSMTGYGRARGSNQGITVTAEIKSVNSRYLEFSPRVLRAYSFLEDRLRRTVQGIISRGKVECSIQIEIEDDEAITVRVNKSLAEGYYKALQQMTEELSLPNEISASRIAAFPDVLTVQKLPADEEKIWSAVSPVLLAACENFVAMRVREGEKLRADILSRAAHIESLVQTVEERSPQTVAEYLEKLKTRMRELLEDAAIDEQRLLTEAAIFADKVAVAEETVRLHSHLAQLREMTESSEPIGRKLDFLVQEMNREANTIGSKAQDIQIAKVVIEIKSEIEKIREQIQNIE